MSSYLVESGREFSYTISGVVRVQPTLSIIEYPPGNFTPWLGAPHGYFWTFLPLATVGYVVAEFSYTDSGGLTPETRWWWVTYTLTLDTEEIESEPYLLGTGTWNAVTGIYDWVMEDTVEIPFTFSFTVDTDLMAERAVLSEGTDIWDNQPGSGFELSKLQNINYTFLANEWVATASLDGVDLENPLNGDYEGSEMTYGITLDAIARLEGFSQTFDCTTVEVEYTASNAYFGSPIIDTESIAAYGESDTYTTCVATGGGGICKVRSYRDNEELQAGGSHNDDTNNLGLCGIVDSCSGSTIEPGCSLGYMWGNASSELSTWVVVGNDIHTGADELERININANPTIAYSGYWTMNAWGGSYEVDDNPPNTHGGNYIARWDTDSWIERFYSDDGVTEYGGSLADGQPAHPPWLPLPLEEEPPWYDSTVYISNDNLSLSYEGGCCQLVCPTPGETWLHSGENGGGSWFVFDADDNWSIDGCSIENGEDAMLVHVTTPGASISLALSDCLAKDAWLPLRYANLHKFAYPSGGKAVLTIGPHSWYLDESPSVLETTQQLDLCMPDSTEQPNDASMQSEIPYFLPYEKIWDTESVRPDDTEFIWDFPAGWGINRVSTVEVTFDTVGTYALKKLVAYRETLENGSFVKLLVYPHQASWNDKRALGGEFSLQPAGTEVYNSDGHTRDYYEYVKAIFIVDGKVVREYPSGCIYYDDADESIHHIEYALSSSDWNLHGPVDDTFLDHNFLVCGLLPGVYSEDILTNIIGCNYQLMTNFISYPIGVNGNEFWNVSKWRGNGAVQGLAFVGKEPLDTGSVVIQLSGASQGRGYSHTIQTNKLGWYLSNPVNTRGLALVGELSTYLRNRMASRLVGEFSAVVDSIALDAYQDPITIQEYVAGVDVDGFVQLYIFENDAIVDTIQISTSQGSIPSLFQYPTGEARCYYMDETSGDIIQATTNTHWDSISWESIPAPDLAPHEAESWGKHGSLALIPAFGGVGYDESSNKVVGESWGLSWYGVDDNSTGRPCSIAKGRDGESDEWDSWNDFANTLLERQLFSIVKLPCGDALSFYYDSEGIKVWSTQEWDGAGDSGSPTTVVADSDEKCPVVVYNAISNLFYMITWQSDSEELYFRCMKADYSIVSQTALKNCTAISGTLPTGGVLKQRVAMYMNREGELRIFWYNGSEIKSVGILEDGS